MMNPQPLLKNLAEGATVMSHLAFRAPCPACRTLCTWLAWGTYSQSHLQPVVCTACGYDDPYDAEHRSAASC